MLKKFLSYFKRVGHAVASIINFVVLFFVYLFGVSLSFLITRVARKKMFEEFTESCESFWLDREEDKKENLYRQF